MNAPRLTVPLVLESPVRAPDGMGGFQLSWQAVGQVWAEMRSGVGAERAVDGRVRRCSGVSGVGATAFWS